MEAAKAIDAYGAMPGNCTQQSDGRQAYTQALYKGIKTWVRLPKYRAERLGLEVSLRSPGFGGSMGEAL